jgi:hypothetical protein
MHTGLPDCPRYNIALSSSKAGSFTYWIIFIIGASLDRAALELTATPQLYFREPAACRMTLSFGQKHFLWNGLAFIVSEVKLANVFLKNPHLRRGECFIVWARRKPWPGATCGWRPRWRSGRLRRCRTRRPGADFMKPFRPKFTDKT